MDDNYVFTKEEAVFVKQLFEIRHELEKLHAEEATHIDRLLTIMRGHGVCRANSDEFFVDAFRVAVGDRNRVNIEERINVQRRFLH